MAPPPGLLLILLLYNGKQKDDFNLNFSFSRWMVLFISCWQEQ